jgi:hypothetical protein
MEQDATYWAPGAYDGFGSRVLFDPILIKCRWQDTSVLFRNAQGEEVVSEAVVYADRQLAIGGYLALGDNLTNDPLSVGKEIRQRQRSPSLSNDEELEKVML